MMKAIFTLILLLSSASAFAGDYEDGMFACMLRDHTTAIAKLKKPAEQGDVKAQVCLGEMYSTGESGLRDYEQAVYWYTKAAEQGHWEAQYWLGTMYEKGQGVPKDYEQAFYWYTKGAEQGHYFAQIGLGIMYEEGMGVPRDYVQAYLWFGLAAKKPDGYDLDALARKMTAEQIAEAKRLVNEWEARQTKPVETDAEHASAEQSSARGPAASSCINEYFTKLGFPGPLVPLDGGQGRWELALEPSRTDEKVTFYACVPSEPVAKDHSDRETPSLFVICGIGVIDVAAIVAVDYGVQNDRPVVTRFNGAESETATWRISPDKKALVAPVTGGKFAKKLMMHGELSVQLRLNKQKLVEFTYDLRGATDTLQVLRQACKWE